MIIKISFLCQGSSLDCTNKSQKKKKTNLLSNASISQLLQCEHQMSLLHQVFFAQLYNQERQSFVECIFISAKDELLQGDHQILVFFIKCLCLIVQTRHWMQKHQVFWYAFEYLQMRICWKDLIKSDFCSKFSWLDCTINGRPNFLWDVCVSPQKRTCCKVIINLF